MYHYIYNYFKFVILIIDIFTKLNYKYMRGDHFVLQKLKINFDSMQ